MEELAVEVSLAAGRSKQQITVLEWISWIDTSFT